MSSTKCGKLQLMKAFTNARIFTGKEFLDRATLLTAGDKVVAVGKQFPPNAEIFDCGGCILAPGFIDLQIYGGGGYLFAASLNDEALNAIADALVKKGTTGFFITFATNSFEVYRKAVEVVKSNTHPAVLGIQLEGPYINPIKKGAHLDEYIAKPDLNELRELLDFAGGTIKMMTLAPEMCDDATLELLREYHVLISAGHSNATFEEAIQGFRKGIPAATHLFNAMSPLHHRNPGLPGAVFLAEKAMASIIPDGVHVSFETVTIADKILGDRLFFITDAVEECREGDYIYIRKPDRFVLPDGTLAGSALTLPLAVKNAVQKAELPLEKALRKASYLPARLAGMTGRGTLNAGERADFVCLDGSLDLKFTVFGGRLILP